MTPHSCDLSLASADTGEPTTVLARHRVRRAAIAALAVAMALTISSPLLASARPQNHKVPQYVKQASPGNDKLKGTTRGEVIDARAGNDTVSAYGGNDVVKGQIGDDVVYGGPGSDLLLL